MKKYNSDEILQRFKHVVDVKEDGKYSVFAKKTGIPVSTFQNYLKNRRLPKMENLLLISEKYDVDLNWLLTGEGDMFAGQSHIVRQSGSGNIASSGNSITGSGNTVGNSVFQNNSTVSVVPKGGGGTAEPGEAGSVRAMRLLARIMETGNPALINAAIEHLDSLLKLGEKMKKEG